MDEQIEADFLLEAHNGLDLVGDEFVVLLSGDVVLGELGTSLTDLLGLLNQNTQMSSVPRPQRTITNRE